LSSLAGRGEVTAVERVLAGFNRLLVVVRTVLRVGRVVSSIMRVHPGNHTVGLIGLSSEFNIEMNPLIGNVGSFRLPSSTTKMRPYWSSTPTSS
jgi:hypothetical protein